MLDGAADLDQLLAGRAEAFDGPVGAQREMMVGDQTCGFLDHPAAMHPAKGKALLAAEEDVLGDREMRRQQGFLVHHGNAGGGGFGGMGKRYLAVFPEHQAGVAAHHAGHDLHEGGLSGAVLAEEQVHLALGHEQVAVAQGGYAAKSFLNAAEIEEHRKATVYNRMAGRLRLTLAGLRVG